MSICSLIRSTYNSFPNTRNKFVRSLGSQKNNTSFLRLQPHRSLKINLKPHLACGIGARTLMQQKGNWKEVFGRRYGTSLSTEKLETKNKEMKRMRCLVLSNTNGSPNDMSDQEITRVWRTAEDVAATIHNPAAVEKEKEKEKKKEKGVTDDNDGESARRNSLEKLISRLSLTNGVFTFLIPFLYTIVRAEHQHPTPFTARPKTMWAFVLSTVVYAFLYAVSLEFSHLPCFLYTKLLGIMAGSLSSVSLVSALATPSTGVVLFVVWGIISIVAVACCIIKSRCPRIHNRIVETLRKLPSTCCNCIFKTFNKISSGFQPCNSKEEEENAQASV